jgi:hypothetical protein
MMKMKAIHSKLLKAQGAISAIAKNKINPHFKNNYFDINEILSHVLPVLHDNGLTLTQPIKDGSVYSVITDSESGEFVDSSLPLPTEPNPQKLGSAITYFRRYTLQSLLSLQAEDDDANKISIVWLTDAQFNGAIESGVSGISATLKVFSGSNGKDMSKDYRQRLQQKLQTLSES